MNAILTIETSTPIARVGVFDVDTGARRAAAEAPSERHSANLLRLCVEVTTQAGTPISTLGAIACGAGPGSFTGLRVGFAVAKGLALPFDIPLILVSSLAALAWDLSFAAAPGETMLPCLDAGKGQVYAALFARSGEAAAPVGVLARSDDWAVAPQGLADVVMAAEAKSPPGSLVCGGPGSQRYREVLAAGFGSRLRFVDVPGPSADAVAALARDPWRRRAFADLATAVPAYGRAPDITRPKPVSR